MNNATTMNPMMINNVRLSYPHLFKRAIYQNKATSYRVALMLDPNYHADAINMLRQDVNTIRNMIGWQAFPFWHESFMSDGNSKEKFPKNTEYRGHLIASASNSTMPTIVDRGQRRLSEEEAEPWNYGGVTANVEVEVYYVEAAKRICLRLLGVQFMEKTPAIGGRVSDADSFQRYDDGGSAQRVQPQVAQPQAHVGQPQGYATQPQYSQQQEFAGQPQPMSYGGQPPPAAQVPPHPAGVPYQQARVPTQVADSDFGAPAQPQYAQQPPPPAYATQAVNQAMSQLPPQYAPQQAQTGYDDPPQGNDFGMPPAPGGFPDSEMEQGPPPPPPYTPPAPQMPPPPPAQPQVRPAAPMQAGQPMVQQAPPMAPAATGRIRK